MNKLRAMNLLIAARQNGLANEALVAKIENRERRGYVLRDGTLVLLGVNSQLQLLRVLKGIRSGNAATDWHGYIEDYAKRMEKLIRQFRVTSILGHSLGGATANYLAVHHNLPALTFAAPRSYRGGKRWSAAESRILNVIRADDPAEVYLRGSRYRRPGRTVAINPREQQSNGSHRMTDYKRIAHLIVPQNSGARPTRLA